MCDNSLCIVMNSTLLQWTPMFEAYILIILIHVLIVEQESTLVVEHYYTTSKMHDYILLFKLQIVIVCYNFLSVDYPLDTHSDTRAHWQIFRVLII